MNTLHKIVERTLIMVFALCFSFVSLYIPHYFNKPVTVEATGVIAGATEPTQILNNLELMAVNAFASISASADTITSAMTSNLWIKENILDGIGWALAKGVLSSMTSSIVNWINSGFKGSPMFIQDISNYLLEVGDNTIGQYLQELGGPLSFICSPFKLDVRLALAIEYDQVRDIKNSHAASSCTLTGALSNIEGFMDGTQNFTDAGGWDAWFSITSNPGTYTPYGSILAAKTTANARLINARGEEIKLLDFGDGFLSSKICETVQGAGTSRQDCFVSTPGKVISEALTFQLSTGPRSLIEADEINEIVGALFGQLTKQVITGAAGLLGLSAGTGYTYTGVPLTTQLTNSGVMDPDKIRQLLVEARDIEVNYRFLALKYSPLLINYSLVPTNNAERRNNAQAAATAIPAIEASILSNILELDSLILRINSIPPPASAEEKDRLMQSISQDYTALLSKLHTQAEVTAQENSWKGILR